MTSDFDDHAFFSLLSYVKEGFVQGFAAGSRHPDIKARRKKATKPKPKGRMTSKCRAKQIKGKLQRERRKIVIDAG